MTRPAFGWAVVTRRGRILVDTVCNTQEEAKHFFSEDQKKKGSRLRQVFVQLTVVRTKKRPPNRVA